MGMWDSPSDPSIYSFLDIDLTNVNKYLDSYNEKHKIKVGPAHLVGKIIAQSLKEIPEANMIIRGSRLYFRENIQLFFQVNIPGKKKLGSKGKDNLAGATIDHAECLSSAQIAKVLKQKALKIRENKDKEISSSFNVVKMIPWFLMKRFLNLISSVIYGCNINMSFMGIARDPFGSVMITNIGSLGVEKGLAPLISYSRVPILLTIGKTRLIPMVINGEVRACEGFTLGVTIDHRVLDGSHGAKIQKKIQESFLDPEKYLFND